MTGLLFFLLERLSIRQDYAGSQGISLPVDDFDCSRTLAHMVLFTYDDVIVKALGRKLTCDGWMTKSWVFLPVQTVLNSWARGQSIRETASYAECEKVTNSLAVRGSASLSP